MKKFKKAIMLFLCAIAACIPFLTIGCGDDPGRGLSNVVDDLQYDENGEIIFNADGKNINLKVWSIIGDPDDKYFDVINTMFNDYYRVNGLSARVTPVATSRFYSQLANMLKTDPTNAPDVVIFHSERLPNLASENIIMPMDSFFDAIRDGTFSADNYVESVMEECYYGGEIYGVPLDMHSGVWFCRQDILEKNGLSVPHTLSEFVSVNNALIEKYNAGNLWYRSLDGGVWKKSKDFGSEYNPVVMSAEGGIETGWIPQTAVLQNGGKLTDATGRPAWKTQGLEDVMEIFRDWQSGNGDFKGTPYSGRFVASNNDTKTVWSSLASGRAVFSFEGSWWIEDRLNEYEDALGKKTDSEGKAYQPLTIINPSKMFALDETKDYASRVYGVGHCVSICSTVTSKTRCVAGALYAQFVTENSAEYTQGGHLPANKAVLASEKYTSLPCYDRYLDLFTKPEDFVMLGGTKNYSAVYECLKNVYADVFSSLKQSVSVPDLITSRYNEAMRMIDAAEEL